jgi:hypothetical protein
MTENRTQLPCAIADLTAPPQTTGTRYCQKCGVWYNPADSQGDWDHNH